MEAPNSRERALSDVEKHLGLPEADRMFKHLELLDGLKEREQQREILGNREELKNTLAQKLIDTFVKTNAAVLLVIVTLTLAEFFMVMKIDNYERIINTNVYLAYVAATAAQVGAIAVTISNKFFNDDS